MGSRFPANRRRGVVWAVAAPPTGEEALFRQSLHRQQAPAAATLCVGRPHRVRKRTKSRMIYLQTLRRFDGELGTPEFFGHRLQNLMTRATLDEITAGLTQRCVRNLSWLMGEPSMTSRGCAWVRWHKGCQEEFRLKARGGGRCRPRSLALGVRTTACDPHALDGDQCGEQRGSDLKHRTSLPC